MKDDDQEQKKVIDMLERVAYLLDAQKVPKDGRMFWDGVKMHGEKVSDDHKPTDLT